MPTPPPPPLPPTHPTAAGHTCPTCKLFYTTDVFFATPRCPWCRGQRAQRCARCNIFKLRQHYNRTGWGAGVCAGCWPWLGGATQRWEVVSELGLGGQVIIGHGQQRVLRQAVTRGVIMRITSPITGHIGSTLARQTDILPASPTSPYLHIFVGETITCVDTTADDVWFRSRDPPSLVIVLTIMKLRYPLLEDHLIRGVSLQQEGRELLVCNVAEGGEVAWQVMVDQLLRCAPSCKVMVQTLLEGLSYKATITMCEE